MLLAMAGTDFIANFQQYLKPNDDPSHMQRIADAFPDVIMIDFDRDRQAAADTAEHIAGVLQSKATIMAISGQSEPEMIIGAMRSGCSEYLAKPVDVDRLARAFAKVESRRRDRDKTQNRGKIITTLGAKGGSGVTTIAVHFSTFLAQLSKQKTLLIDQHSDLGDISLFLGVEKHHYHFYELVNNVDRLDAKLVQGFVVRHGSGLDILGSPDTFDSAVNVSPRDVEVTLDFLRTVYDCVVIDCAPGLSGLTLAAVQKSDEVWLIATPDVPSVRNLSRYLQHLIRFSYPLDAVRILINRYSKRGPITKEHMERVLKRPVHLTLPNNYAEVMEAVNSGNPMLPQTKSEFAAAVKHWVQGFAAEGRGQAVQEEPSRRRWAMLGL